MSTLAIKVEEVSDATGFKLYDETIWDGGYDDDNLSVALLTVTYEGTDYTLDLLDPDIIADPGDGSFINIFGTSCSSYIEISPAVLLDGESNSLAAERFIDGYYLIKLDITHGTDAGSPLSDTNSQGFIAHAECRATVAPLEINLDNYDYQYNRTLFLLITQLPSAKYAASLGRVTQFDTIMDRIVAFLDASSINKCW